MAVIIQGLVLRSPFHIGERGVGLEVTRSYAPADTLFGALCCAWRMLYGPQALQADVLEPFKSGSAPFFLSSAFPFAGSVRFFPKPLLRCPVEEKDEKAFKRVRWVSEGVFRRIVEGDKPAFNKRDCVNGQVVWVSPKEKDQLAGWTDDLTGDIVLWKSNVVPRVTLDRITSASQIWHFGTAVLQAGTGLWFAVEFQPGLGGQARHKFEACLRVLGDTGLGGERGAGHGLFDLVDLKEESMPGAVDAQSFVTLAPVCPKDEAEGSALINGAAAYELMPRRGWVTSPEASNLRRKMVWMLAEGSVLNGPPEPRAGCLANVKPDACPHEVWRYGYAFPVGVKI